MTPTSGDSPVTQPPPVVLQVHFMHINAEGYYMSSDEEEANATFLTGLELDTSDYESQHDVNVGPIRLNGSVYRHQGHGYAVDVRDQPEKVSIAHLEPFALTSPVVFCLCVITYMMLQGLSFQVWPSSRTLLRYLDYHQPDIWQVCTSWETSHRLPIIQESHQTCKDTPLSCGAGEACG